MDPELKSLLQNLEHGDYEVIPKLADWLETHGDPRAELARQATTLHPQEIADELVKVRSMRPTHDSLVNVLVMLWVAAATGAPDLIPVAFRASQWETAPTTPVWWPPSAEKCLNDVEKTIETKKLPADIARAMTNARRIKVDRLLAAFQPGEQPTPLLPPGPD
jgi:hypothetical protein